MISIVGFVLAGIMWAEFDQRLYIASTILGSSPFTRNDGYKMLTLAMVAGMGAWIPSVALGDSTKELLGFYDAYNTKVEGYKDGDRDPDGTSIAYDLSFHSVAGAAYETLAFAMWLGGTIFAFVFMWGPNPISEESCDLSDLPANFNA